MQLRSSHKVPYLTFDSLTHTGLVTHAMSTRLGGVSGEHLSSMNLGFAKGDIPSNVSENYRRIGLALGIASEDMVMSVLEHGTVVRKVTGADKGKGIVRETDFTGCDGLMTDEPGLCLVCRYADCVPLFFVDPVHKAIALSHSGWRGTAGRMAAVTVAGLRREYGSDPGDILCGIGPSICGDCFEVGPEVAEIFDRSYPGRRQEIMKQGMGDRLLVDLWRCNKIALMDAGIPEDHIEMSGLCTCCNSELLFSHRDTGGRRGDMAGFLMLKEE